MKVLTTPRSYGKTDPEVFAMLRAAGLEVVRNETGGILDKEGMKALLALMIAFVPVLMVLMAFPELGDQVPMKVNAAGEVLRYGSKGELLFLPVMGFMLSAATVAMGLKQARKYGDDLTMATITFTRAGRNAIVQGVVFVAATGILLYGALSGHGIGF